NESILINANLGNGLVQILDSSDTDYVIDGPDLLFNTAADFYLLTGGNITMLSSYQNEGTGNVTLVAGWNGVGSANTAWELIYPSDGQGGYNYFFPVITQGALTGVDFNNCDTFGNNGKTLTIGSSSQTDGVGIGSRSGSNIFAAHRIERRAATVNG